MKKENLNTLLLSICTVLLIVCAIGIYNQPTLEEIDQRIMHWEQHYGSHFSELSRQNSVR